MVTWVPVAQVILTAKPVWAGPGQGGLGLAEPGQWAEGRVAREALAAPEVELAGAVSANP